MGRGAETVAQEKEVIACRRFAGVSTSRHETCFIHLWVLMLAGCVVIPSKRVTFNDIKIGMPRDEAVALLGKPSRVSAKGNVENLYYNESALYIGILGIGKVRNDKREYEMRLVDGKVASFGEVGEYIEEDDGSDSDN